MGKLEKVRIATCDNVSNMKEVETRRRLVYVFTKSMNKSYHSHHIFTYLSPLIIAPILSIYPNLISLLYSLLPEFSLSDNNFPCAKSIISESKFIHKMAITETCSFRGENGEEGISSKILFFFFLDPGVPQPS